MDLSAAENELYGVTPEEFVETRKRLAAEAKQAGDRDLAKRIGALRRPTASAWAINQLTRASPDELGWLSDVGADLRTAWAAGRHVGGLDQRRGELIDLLGRTTRALAKEAGRPLHESAAREVEETLHAATMDPAVAGEVRSGRLTQPRSHVGFVPAGVPVRPAEEPGDQGVRPATEQPRDTRRKRPTGRDRSEREQAEREQAEREQAEREGERLAERARAAAAEAREADRALAVRDSEADAAERAHAGLADEAERLRRQLDDILDRRDAAMEGLRAARRERDQAAGRAEEARRRADEARRRSDEAGSSGRRNGF
jgi:hypothetical protein